MLDTTKEEDQQEFHLPPIETMTVKDNKLRVPSGRRSSLRLPSLGSIIESDNESLDDSSRPDSSDSAFEETSELSSNSSFVGRSDSIFSATQTIVLQAEEEKEIEKKVKQEFKQEFQNIKAQTRSKQNVLRKHFKSKIDAARAKLLLARANAERVSIDKLQQNAEIQEAHIMKERKKRRDSKQTWEHVNDTVSDLAALRKIRSELDRARARRRSSIATSLIVTRHKGFKFGGGFTDSEIKKLEKQDEIQKIVEELQNLGLTDAADGLVSSLHTKMDNEEQLVDNLKQERQQAKIKAQQKRNSEVTRLRKEKIEEKEMIERERIRWEAEEVERLKRERRIRIMNALRRKAFNIEMKKTFNQTKLTSRISRPYTYSYYDTQK